MDFRVNNITVSTSTSLGSGSSIFVLGQDFTSTSTDAEKTSYYCKTFSLETLDVSTFHAVQFNPIIEPGNKKKVHHILLYECPGLAYDSASANYEGRCWGDEAPSSVKNCNFGKVIAGWAIGGGPIMMPEVAGMRFGNGIHNKYALMEIHYDNYDGADFVDSSGLRMLYTPTLRQHDVGVLSTGALAGLHIPAGEESYSVNARCPSGCTSSVRSDGVTIFSSFLHAHTSATSIHAALLDGSGTFKESLGAEPFYDFNFQQAIALNATVMPGDQLHVKCTFNTQHRTKATRFGLATDDEMCLTYLWYYPYDSSLPNSNGCIFTNFDLSTYETVDIRPDPYADDLLPIALCENAGFDLASPSEPGKMIEDKICKSTFQDEQPMFLEGAEAAFDRTLYSFSKELEDGFKIFWNFNEDDQVLDLAALAQTDGWVGIGFGRGAMAGSDVVIGWLDEDGGYHFSDRFAVANDVPVVDSEISYFNIAVMAGQCNENGENCVWEDAIKSDLISTVLMSGGTTSSPTSSPPMVLLALLLMTLLLK